MAVVPDEYQLIRHLGDGSFADVFLVRHKELGYIRALKISKDYIEDENDKKWKKFLKECKLLLQIGNGNHPNIVHIFRPSLEDHKAMVEMDYVDGISLRRYIKEKRFLTIEEVTQFINEVVDALAYCHVDSYIYLLNPREDNLTPSMEDGTKYDISPQKEKELIKKYGICHNDLHSGNIMRCNRNGAFMLLDFGLAMQDEMSVNSTNRNAGAYEYMSPEKINGQKPDPRSDIYSLGILLFEVMTGEVPFKLDHSNKSESALNALYMQHKTADIPALLPLRRKVFEYSTGKTYNRDFPESLEEVIRKCLAKNPDDRYTNAKELLDALHAALTMPAMENRAESLTPLKKSAKESKNTSEDAKASVRNEADSIKTELAEKTSQLAVTKRNNNLWKLLAFIATLILVIGLIWAITSKPEVKATDSVSTQDSIVAINNTGNNPILTDLSTSSAQVTPTVHDTIVVRDTVNITNTVKSEPITIEKTKIEYRNSPETQKELERLRNENKTLKGQVERYKESLTK